MDDPVFVGDLGPSKPPPASVYDDMFDSYFSRAAEPPDHSPSSPPRPVFDKPVFDDDPEVDPFDAIPLFGGGGSGERRAEPEAAGLEDDLFPGLGDSSKPASQMEPPEAPAGLDETGTNHHDSPREEPIKIQESESFSSSKISVSTPEDPFVILGATSKLGYSSFGLFSDHLHNIGMPMKSENPKVDVPANTNTIFESSDIFAGFPNDMPSFSFTSEKESGRNEVRPIDNLNRRSDSYQTPQEKPVQQGSEEAPSNILPEMNVCEPSVIYEVPGTTGFQTLNPFAMDIPNELPEENQHSTNPYDVWLTVSDITLVTQPTSAPPPSRPPPPLGTKQLPTESVTSEAYPHHHNQGFHHYVGSAESQIDELEGFFMEKPAMFANGHPRVLNHERKEHHSSIDPASFMDSAELRHSKGLNQGSFASSSQCRKQEIDDKSELCAHEVQNKDEERLGNEQIQREHEEEQRRAEREREEELEREREKVRRREQEDQKRREKERESRQAVEKAVREARNRAAAEARMKAERESRLRAERAAVQKATAEARERAAVEARERAAKAAAQAKERAAADARERAAAESRERAAAEAREREAAEAREEAAKSQEKAAAEARTKAERAAVDKAAAEARRRAERAVFERVAAEARQRAANEAKERAVAEARARENQQRTATAEADFESFFGMPSRSSSVPRSHTATTNPFDVQPQGSSGSGAVRGTSSDSVSPFTQPSSSNLVDDLSSIFGAPPSSAGFQVVGGETEERRKARLERHQRTMERTAKALAEKNERDLLAQREQEERHRIGETLDFEIKRWAAGKEGNLRALLSTLQYVLWPECGWRPVSLTDLITAASVKKEYRRATLCIHPDKVQQKGANLQQKYIAEKVFDLLKEAWNKFNSEELL